MMVTNPCTNDARVLKEATTLSKSGYDVVILATMGATTVDVEHMMGFTIKRKKRRFRGNTLLGKLEFTLKFTSVAINENADVYHAHDLSTLLECYLSSRLKKAKLVYDSHELHVDPSKRGFGVYLYNFLEKVLIKKADVVITVNKHISKILERRYELNDGPVVVMNCPPLKLTQGGDSCGKDDILPNIYNITNKNNRKIILYQGAIQKERGEMGLAELVESMKYMDTEYYLLLVGGGSLKKELEEMSMELGLDQRIYFTGMVSLKQLSEYTKLADVGVVLLKKTSLNHYYASPNKLFEYIHANVPVLAPNYPFFKDVIGKYDIGILIDEIEPEEIADKIKLFFKDMNRYKEMKENTKIAEKELNWENEEKNLIAAYDRIQER
jgi:glycosyltransferase involved in cell wall biosynthesis